MIALDRGPRFSLGEIIVTPGAAMRLSQEEIHSAVRRHSRGDWSDMEAAGRAENERALDRGTTVASIYLAANGVKFYVVTEADRAVTTVLLPEEY